MLSNLDEANTVSAVVGKSNAEPRVKYAQAVQFRTGGNERGYNLTSVRAVLANAADSDGVRVRIFNSHTNGSPFEIVYTLSNPTLSDGVNTCGAAAPERVRMLNAVASTKLAFQFLVLTAARSGEV